MCELNIDLDKISCPTEEEWKEMCEQAIKEHISWEDQEAIADQMERMGGGNLIGRPSPYV
jgi:hypothetical protein